MDDKGSSTHVNFVSVSRICLAATITTTTRLLSSSWRRGHDTIPNSKVGDATVTTAAKTTEQIDEGLLAPCTDNVDESL
jgi:hypothetical protein